MSTITSAAASATTTAPFFNASNDFKLLPIVIALVSFCLLGIASLCVMTACNMRRMRRMLDEQRDNPRAHDDGQTNTVFSRLNKPAKPKLPPKPIMTTIQVENKTWDYREKVDWTDVMPLTAELILFDDKDEAKSLFHDHSPDISQISVNAVKSSGHRQLDLGVLINLPSPVNERYPTMPVNASKSSTSFVPEQHVPATVIGSSRVNIGKLR